MPLDCDPAAFATTGCGFSCVGPPTERDGGVSNGGVVRSAALARGGTRTGNGAEVCFWQLAVSKMQTAGSSNLQQWVIRTPGGNTGATSIALQLESQFRKYPSRNSTQCDSRLPVGRMNERNGFPPATAVHSEVIQISCDHRIFPMELAEANEAQIREIGPPISKARC